MSSSDIHFNWHAIDSDQNQDQSLYIKKTSFHGRDLYVVTRLSTYSENSFISFLEQKSSLFHKLLKWKREKQIKNDKNILVLPSSFTADPKASRQQRHLKVIEFVREKLETDTNLQKQLRINPEKILHMLSDANKVLFQEDVRELKMPSKTVTKTPCFSIGRESIKENPELVISNLYQKLVVPGAAKSFQVKFTDEQGLDLGGLKRELASELFAHLVKPHKTQKMHFKELEGGVIIPELQNADSYDWDEYIHMGAILLAFDHFNCPIGTVFEPKMFDVILSFTNEELSEPLTVDMIGKNQLRYIDLFKKLQTDHPENIQTIDLMLQSLTYTDEQLEEYGLGERMELENDINNYLFCHIAPLHSIAVGMKNSPYCDDAKWEAYRKTPEKFSQKIQGSIDKKMIIESLVFEKLVNEEHREWIRRWIREADDDEIKSFLKTITASSSLANQSASIAISMSADTFRYSTCGKAARIPFTQCSSYEEFKPLFSATLTGKSQFDMR